MTNEKKRYPLLMLSYGANVGARAMKHRAPTAEFVGTAVLRSHRLVFRGVADVIADKRFDTHVAVWNIQAQDEINLDRFEGFPNLYIKRYADIRVDGRMRKAMYYVMRSREYFALPAQSYEQCLREGYAERGMPIKQIDIAVAHARKHQSVFRSRSSWDRKDSLNAANERAKEAARLDHDELDPLDYEMTMALARRSLPSSRPTVPAPRVARPWPYSKTGVGGYDSEYLQRELFKHAEPVNIRPVSSISPRSNKGK